MRLQEGFSFAHSASGIFTFLLEVDMEVMKPVPNYVSIVSVISLFCAMY
jgi:KICSTOR complex protein SZT2